MSNRPMLNLPKHVNPRPERTASAPYNFIPLPETVVAAVDNANELPDHDRYCSDRHTGYFEVTLTTKSPLYVRCPFTLSEFLRQERREDENASFRQQVKNTPHFFYIRNPSQPVIPGSSLRGMLRSVLEVVSYGKVERVTEKKLFFRTVDDTAVGRHYRARMTGKVEAGFLRRKADGHVIKICQIVRVQRNKLGGNPYEGQAPNKTPRWSGQPHQWKRVWVRLSRGDRFVDEVSYEPTPQFREGLLIITGDIPGKKKEFVFLMPAEGAEEIPVSEELIERFHDDDQITQWQERAFPKDKPDPNCRERSGMVRKNLQGQGDPVFFLRENGQLTFFGRAQMFRLPYTQRPLDLVPPELRQPEDIDYAEAIFGFVRTRQELDYMRQRGVIQEAPPQGDKRRAYAGRVFVTDATLIEGQSDIWLSQDPIVPKILASPKPTAFQHYLVQTNDDKNTLEHYDSKTPDETVIRGHKRYWHQGLNADEGLTLDQIRELIEDERARLGQLAATSTQHTQFKPVKPGVQFKFRIYFENLSDRELGALCWTLHPLGDPSKEYCHHLGMGKPLGMGAVKLEATLHLTNRQMRYTSLFSGDTWQTGITGAGESLANRAALEARTSEFEQHILGELRLNRPCSHLFEMERIGMLLKMMEWPGFRPNENGGRYLKQPGRPNTRYMLIQHPNYGNEYRDRPVLPDPRAFNPSISNLAEPSPSSSAVSNTTLTTQQPGKQKGRKPKAEPAKVTTKKEWVILVENVAGGKAKVRTEDGEIVSCGNFPSYPQGMTEMRCRADVTRQDGKAQRATFKGWK